ncbi:hypothetical protein [Nesterenkonia sp. F]|uniref:hypothetical protein n=1 Tax=Nesterenkonia sp. F TaxID=795955 RepID=UPI000255D0F6
MSSENSQENSREHSPESRPGHSPEGTGETDAPAVPRNRGVGMLIITAYGIFAVSSTARALYQLIVHFEDAPVAYVLSAAAAAVYILATLALARTSAAAWRTALVAVLVELVGVVGVGLWTVLEPRLFADATVWSHFGQGYGHVPLVLPLIGLFWLLRHRPDARRAPAARAAQESVHESVQESETRE